MRRRIIWLETDVKSFRLLADDPTLDFQLLMGQDERQASGEQQMQIHIIELLDRLLRAAHCPVDAVQGASPTIHKLMDLDQEIRDYMHSIMDSEVEDSTFRTAVSNCVALSVRSVECKYHHDELAHETI